MFAISSFDFWADAVVVMTSMKNVFVDKVGISFIEKHNDFAEKFALLGLSSGTQSSFGECTTVCLLGFFGCFAQNDWPVINPETCNALVVSGYSLSLITNIAGTVAIGVQVWLYKRNVRAYLTVYKEGRIEKILVLLLESGVVYSLVWVVQLVIIHIPPPLTLSGKVTQQIFRAGSVQLVGIYPTALVVLIYLQRSMWGPSGNSTFVEPSVNRDPGEGGSQSTIFEKHQA
ncbi:hypothetical protein AAF712_015135 [Marasmius tenuissimus]|uniref:Uncharacterized protein n=1 Tax=Marasmius tenuissimus TaxID=585030 RepID=A0ABR2Z948_9AGAR